MDESGAGRRFPETSWSALRELSDPADPQRAERLNRFLGRYWKPAFHYIRAMRRLSTPDAEDVTQGFFTMFLARVDIAKLSQERGQFRGFLKTALRRHIATGERTKDAQMRRGQAPLLAHEDAESLRQHDEQVNPEEAFDRAWARGVLKDAVAQMEQEFTATGRAIYFEVFRQYCLEPAADVSYEKVARENQLSVDDVRNYLRAVRGRGKEIVRDLVREHLSSEENIEEELRLIYAT